MAELTKCVRCGRKRPLSQFPINRFNPPLERDFWCIDCKKSHVMNETTVEEYCKENNRDYNPAIYAKCLSLAVVKVNELVKGGKKVSNVMKEAEKIASARYFSHAVLNNGEKRGNKPKPVEVIEEEVSDNGTVKQVKRVVTHEKSTYSKVWYGEFNKRDIEYLDTYLQGLHRDFKITTSNHLDYAKKIAKASLWMDKCQEELFRGIKGADTQYKNACETFDKLSKSAQFSENTRSANDVTLGCFGRVFAQVEEHNWIPIHTPVEKDDLDNLIDNLRIILKSV